MTDIRTVEDIEAEIAAIVARERALGESHTERIAAMLAATTGGNLLDPVEVAKLAIEASLREQGLWPYTSRLEAMQIAAGGAAAAVPTRPVLTLVWSAEPAAVPPDGEQFSEPKP